MVYCVTLSAARAKIHENKIHIGSGTTGFVLQQKNQKEETKCLVIQDHHGKFLVVLVFH